MDVAHAPPRPPSCSAYSRRWTPLLVERKKKRERERERGKKIKREERREKTRGYARNHRVFYLSLLGKRAFFLYSRALAAYCFLFLSFLFSPSFSLFLPYFFSFSLLSVFRFFFFSPVCAPVHARFLRTQSRILFGAHDDTSVMGNGDQRGGKNCCSTVRCLWYGWEARGFPSSRAFLSNENTLMLDWFDPIRIFIANFFYLFFFFLFFIEHCNFTFNIKSFLKKIFFYRVYIIYHIYDLNFLNVGIPWTLVK